MSSDLFLGTCIHFNDTGSRPLDYQLMRDAGMTWTRVDVPFPFDGAPEKEHARYQAVKAQIRALRAEGIRTLGITPYMRDWPILTGEIGSRSFLAMYQRACAYMAKDLSDVIDTWQVSNELNLAWFRRPFATEEEALPFLIYGGLGIREGNPAARVGINMATGHVASADRMYRALYPSNTLRWDFVGVDAYYGSWEPGGPEAWGGTIDRIFALCGGVEIIVMEYGYASDGGTMTDEERGPQEYSSQQLHKVSKWPYGWGSGHDTESQARYCTAALRIFAEHPKVSGAFWYKWNDGRQCGCGNAGCPENRAYGLVAGDQTPKPAWHAHRKAAQILGRLV